MKPEVKVFDRSSPCTKLDIWNCFKGVRGWKRVQVDTAHSLIGVNAPKNMLNKEYVTKGVSRDVEYYVLTISGQEWLTEKFKTYLRTHPEKYGEAKNLPKSF